MTLDSGQEMTAVDFGSHEIERHVRQALEEAWRRSGGEPLSAADVLRACLAIGNSPAFTTLRNLLPQMYTPPTETTPRAPFSLSSVALDRPLADSYYLATSFFLTASDKAIWGRDLVTMALLTRDDPSLQAFVAEASTSVDDLRDKWLYFLRDSKEQHRTSDEWDRWWHAAGVPTDQSPRPPATRPAYLLTWNPDRFSETQMSELIANRGEDGLVTFGWSSGNNRSMVVGDRVFLLRQGRSTRGLIGVGTVSEPPKATSHWDQSNRAEGKSSWVVQVRWNMVQLEPIIDRQTLESATGESRLWSTQAGGVTIIPSIRERLEEIWPSALPISDTGPKQLIAWFDPDVAAATDSLDVQRYVDAFARVAASKDLTPPLSVGIFGDWGSGKSFFMERIEAKIKELAKPTGSPDDNRYVHKICQIRFNAWHFAETDLWASLTSTIFKKLQSYLDDEDDDPSEFTRLAKRLEIARAMREHTETRVQEAGKTLRESEKAVARAETRLRAAHAPVPTAAQYRDILRQEFKDGGSMPKLLQEASALTGDESFEMARKGLDLSKTTVAEANYLFAQITAMRSRVSFWWRVLRQAKLYKTRWFWAVALLFLAMTSFAAVVGHSTGLSVKLAVAIGLQALTLVGGMVGLAARTLAKAEPVFKHLDQMQQSIKKKIEQLPKPERERYLRALDQAVKKKQSDVKDLKAAEESRNKADREFKDALAAAQEPSEARLGRFIRGRAGSGDYEKHLGMSAMVREDFDELSRLILSTKARRDETLPSIDRIILYIDDLDRCYPPSTVVRVLEAVHLLLAFPLFVVFVGVDSRWVSRSLNRHYDQMLRDEELPVDGIGSVSGQEPANSQDFLEKIFQVPFWLRPMQPDAVRNMLDGLITRDERYEHRVIPTTGEASPPPVPAPDDGRDDAVPEPPPEFKEEYKNDEEGESRSEPRATATEALRILEVERDFMKQVAPLMPRTPRAVKRFVNIYRLYKAGLSPVELEEFLDHGERKGNFRAVQILLALVISTPSLAKAVVEILEGPKDSGSQYLSNLATKLAESEDATWHTTNDALMAFAQVSDNNLTLESLRRVGSKVTRYSLHHMITPPPDDVGQTK